MKKTDGEQITATPVIPDKDKVDFYAFKDNDKYKDDIFVAVNGRSFKIQRGKHVRIPRYVAEVLENGMDQDAKTANLIEREGELAKAREIN